MLLKFEDAISCMACELEKHEEAAPTSRKSSMNARSEEYLTFLNKLKDSKVITKNETSLSSLDVHIADVSKNISKTVNCISCRTAVERLLKQIVASSQHQTNQCSLALDPIRIDRAGNISLSQSLLKPDPLYQLIYTDR